MRAESSHNEKWLGTSKSQNSFILQAWLYIKGPHLVSPALEAVMYPAGLSYYPIKFWFDRVFNISISPGLSLSFASLGFVSSFGFNATEETQHTTDRFLLLRSDILKAFTIWLYFSLVFIALLMWLFLYFIWFSWKSPFGVVEWVFPTELAACSVLSFFFSVMFHILI